jgi:tellurite resistance protein
VLLSALAHVGHQDDTDIKEAFQRGVATLNATLQFIELSACGLPEIDVALDRLAQASPAIKKIVLNACAETVASDGIIQPEEAELLRAVAETLECPIPPFVQGV